MTSIKPDAAQQRENADPDEQVKPVPFVLLFLIAGLFTWAIVYLATSDLSGNQNWGDSRTAADFATPVATTKVDGAALFSANCVACHQANGNGIAGVFPPLAESDWIVAKEDAAIQILIHGIDGKLTVKGVEYHGQMPHFGAKFNDDEIAAVLTYVRSNFGNHAPAVNTASVKAGREHTAGRDKAWVGDIDLAAFK